jgi:phosphate transport system substrate-binding protein
MLAVCACESHLELVQSEAAQFTSIYKQASVSVFGTTTREAIVGLLNDSVRVIVTDRQLNAEERAAAAAAEMDLEEIAVAKDAFAVVVNRVNETPTFTLDVLKGMLGGRVSDWGQVEGSGLTGPVEVVLTGRNSGAYELLKDRLLDLPEDIRASVVPASQREVLDYVATHAQAVGVVSFACFRSPSALAVTSDSAGAVRALAFWGADSTGRAAAHRLHQANIHLDRYPLTYSVYMYFRKDSNLAAGFAGFVAGPVGQKIILDWGLVPVTMPVRIVTLT